MHFEGFLPAALCDLDAKPYMAELVGAKESEVFVAIIFKLPISRVSVNGPLLYQVCLMNSLTVNLHLALQAFYRPDKAKGRTKILFEAHAFPSDRVTISEDKNKH